MPVRNQNWYDLQEGRRYPMDDRSTGIDDSGAPIADNVIVDCHIRFPNTFGTYAYFSAITVSNNIVTAIISAADDVTAPVTFKPIAAISVAKPIQIGVNQPITPLVPGVAGWIAFGSGIGVNFSGKYATPIQTFISPRCARPYRPLPIPTLGKIDLDTALTGMVNILARTPVTATYEITDVEGEQVPAIVFRLTGDLINYNPLKEFGGPCKGRPESGTCVKLGLQNINGVAPDCNGDIQISAAGFSLLPFLDDAGNCGGGFDLVTDQGLAAACAAGAGGDSPYRRYNDICFPQTSDSENSLPYWPNPLDQIPVPPDVVSSISLGDHDYFGSCYPTRTCFDFMRGTASDFLTRIGLFVFEERNVEENIELCEDATSSASLGVGSKYVYAAADVSGINVAVLSDCNTVNTVSAILQLAPGPRRNGGVILNYVPANSFTRTPQTFVAAVIDIDASALQIVRYNGSNFVVEARVNLPTQTLTWYEIAVNIQPQTNGVLVTATARNIDNAANTATVSTVISQFGEITGSVGLFADRAFTYFSKFTLGD